MNENAQNIYDQITAYLDSVGHSSSIDTFELTRLAKAIDRYQKYTKEIDQRDPGSDDRGFSQTSMYLIWKTSFTEIDKLADKYGLTPIGRKRLGISEVKDAPNPLEGFTS